MVLYWPIRVQEELKGCELGLWFHFMALPNLPLRVDWGCVWVGRPICCSFAHVDPRVAPSLWEGHSQYTWPILLGSLLFTFKILVTSHPIAPPACLPFDTSYLPSFSIIHSLVSSTFLWFNNYSNSCLIW